MPYFNLFKINNKRKFISGGIRTFTLLITERCLYFYIIEIPSSTEMIGNLEPMEASETVPMEAEVAIFNPSPEKSNLDANVPAIEKSPGHVSDLEEGEIED